LLYVVGVSAITVPYESGKNCRLFYYGSGWEWQIGEWELG